MRSLKFLATLFFLVASLAFLSDATPTLLDQHTFFPTRLEQHWIFISPETIENIREYLSDHLPLKVSETIQNLLLRQPTFVVFAALGFVCAYIGRRHDKINVFIN